MLIIEIPGVWVCVLVSFYVSYVDLSFCVGVVLLLWVSSPMYRGLFCEFLCGIRCGFFCGSLWSVVAVGAVAFRTRFGY